MARISIPLGAAARLNGQWTIALGEGARLIARRRQRTGLRLRAIRALAVGSPRRGSKGCLRRHHPCHPARRGLGWGLISPSAAARGGG
jgi:hypothetical protein